MNDTTTFPSDQLCPAYTHWVVLPFLPLRPVELHFLGVSNHAAVTSCCSNFIFKWLHRRCFTFIEFLLPSPRFSTWNLNISHWKRRFRTWKPLFSGSVFKLWGYTLEIGTVGTPTVPLGTSQTNCASWTTKFPIGVAAMTPKVAATKCLGCSFWGPSFSGRFFCFLPCLNRSKSWFLMWKNWTKFCVFFLRCVFFFWRIPN